MSSPRPPPGNHKVAGNPTWLGSSPYLLPRSDAAHDGDRRRIRDVQVLRDLLPCGRARADLHLPSQTRRRSSPTRPGSLASNPRSGLSPGSCPVSALVPYAWDNADIQDNSTAIGRFQDAEVASEGRQFHLFFPSLPHSCFAGIRQLTRRYTWGSLRARSLLCPQSDQPLP